jgi:solute:Na+ symporter, SSS family
MPYPALQLLGTPAVLTAGGVYPRGAGGDGCSLAEYQSIDE